MVEFSNYRKMVNMVAGGGLKEDEARRMLADARVNGFYVFTFPETSILAKMELKVVGGKVNCSVYPRNGTEIFYEDVDSVPSTNPLPEHAPLQKPEPPEKPQQQHLWLVKRDEE